MKRMYWRPRRVSRTALVLISVVSIAGFVGLENFPTRQQEPFHQQKLAAAQLTREAFKIIRAERLRRRLPIDPESDVSQSGLLGSLVTPVTTSAGSLASKQTLANPNFGALVVQYLMDAGVTEGDVVAVGYSGSFPALNVAVLAAIEILKLRPIIIASATSSQWGANDPDFLWLDMEKTLFDAGLIKHRAVAASVGGIEDRGLGMKKRGRRLVQSTIAKHGLTFIDPKDFADSIEQRMRLYRQHAGASSIQAYVNVGGGTISVGRKHGKRQFKPGLNRSTPTSTYPVDSIMGRFLRSSVPVIHLIKIQHLADLYGFPIQPAVMPAVGEGKIFYRERANVWAVAGLLFVIVMSLYLFVRSDLGFRMTRRGRGTGSGHPEPMV